MFKALQLLPLTLAKYYILANNCGKDLKPKQDWLSPVWKLLVSFFLSPYLANKKSTKSLISGIICSGNLLIFASNSVALKEEF